MQLHVGVLAFVGLVDSSRYHGARCGKFINAGIAVLYWLHFYNSESAQVFDVIVDIAQKKMKILLMH